MKTLACLMLLSLATAVSAQGAKPIEAMSRIYNHKDGTRTETLKHGDKNEIHEKTFRNNILICKRVFFCDTKGRTRQGVIYDGREHPLGTILYGYDRSTDQLVEEQQYNKDGKLVRRLFYPGALKGEKYAKFANRYVAFTFDPNDPKSQPVEDTSTPAVPTQPVQSDQDEFTPGVPIGPAAPSASAPRQPAPTTPARPSTLPPAGNTPPATPVPASGTKQPRKHFLTPRKS